MDDFRQVIDLDQATGDDTLRLARTAAEAIRGLNWLTRHEGGLGQPSIAYDIHRRPGPGRLPPRQPLTQVTRWLDQALAAGRSATTSARTPPRHRGRRVFLADARLSAAALAGDLDAAQQQLALINGTPATAKGPAMIDKLQAHYGFTRMPFGRDLAPGMLHRHAAHNEAVARITWCIAERAIGRDHRRGRRRQDRLRPHRPGRPRRLPAHHHLPGRPDDRHPRAPRPIVAALRRPARPQRLRSPPRPPPCSPPSATSAAGPPSWSSTRPTCCATSSSRPSGC